VYRRQRNDMKAFAVVETSMGKVEDLHIFREEPTAVAYAHGKMVDEGFQQQAPQNAAVIEAWGDARHNVVVISCQLDGDDMFYSGSGV
jgi:hypothetical protein